MNRLNNARKFRKEFEANKKTSQKLLRQDQLSSGELLELIDVFDDWIVGEKLEAGDRRKYNGKLYSVIQGHTTQADWAPDVVPALFKKIVPEGVIPDWVQPAGAHDAYKKGDKVTFKGKVYESLIDANTWSPDAYAQGWKVVI